MSQPSRVSSETGPRYPEIENHLIESQLHEAIEMKEIKNLLLKEIQKKAYFNSKSNPSHTPDENWSLAENSHFERFEKTLHFGSNINKNTLILDSKDINNFAQLAFLKYKKIKCITFKSGYFKKDEGKHFVYIHHTINQQKIINTHNWVDQGKGDNKGQHGFTMSSLLRHTLYIRN